jgi:hypothetical protein
MLLKGPPPRPPGLADVVELRQQSLHQLMALFANERRLVSTHPARVQPNDSTHPARLQPNDITAQVDRSRFGGHMD